MTRSYFLVLALAALVLVCLAPGAHAFGAGNIPSFSSQEGVAFRHGDLSDALSSLRKAVGGGLLSRGAKFSGLDIKRIYFGNFLRDYSQAMDVAALEKLPKQTILTIVMVLSFMAFGYATDEFEVTEERLGVYNACEHLDNPAGMYEGIDAKRFDSRLRGPVDPRELEVDPRSGMKNYLCNENQGWDTSSQLIRRTIVNVIQLGREHRRSGSKHALNEAYRELGKAMHAVEDVTAHSNWTELALHKLGHKNVFLHVGDNVRVRSPRGEMVAPLVTGSFGGSDFVHSMLGEASDHLSSASVSDLAKSVGEAKQKQAQGSALSQLLGFLGKVPGMSDGSVSRDAEVLSRGPPKNPEMMSPQEMYANLFKVLAFHDSIMKGIEQTIEKIPGLSSLIDSVGNSVSAFTMTLIEPFIAPLMKSAISGLHATSGAVVSGADQYAVFDDPNASNPTHSQLSKDHFALILNELAGNVAIIMDRHLVNSVVAAWDDERKDPNAVADDCLAVIFHPYWVYDNPHPVQREMLDFAAAWARQHGDDIRRLDKANVRNHTNTRTGKPASHEGCGSALNLSQAGVGQQETGFGPALAQQVQGYIGGKIPGIGRRDLDSDDIGGQGYNRDGRPGMSSEGGSSYNTEPSHQASHSSGSQSYGQPDRYQERPQHERPQHERPQHEQRQDGYQQHQSHYGSDSYSHGQSHGGSSGFPEPDFQQPQSGYGGPMHGYQTPTGPPPPGMGAPYGMPGQPSDQQYGQAPYGSQSSYGGPQQYGQQPPYGSQPQGGYGQGYNGNQW
ncbi:unnamed protein product [Parajaminaea phylloscopi]